MKKCKEVDSEYAAISSSAMELKDITRKESFQKSKNQNLIVLMFKSQCNSVGELFKRTFYQNSLLVKTWTSSLE